MKKRRGQREDILPAFLRTRARRELFGVRPGAESETDLATRRACSCMLTGMSAAFSRALKLMEIATSLTWSSKAEDEDDDEEEEEA